jgi:hypothetical protein
LLIEADIIKDQSYITKSGYVDTTEYKVII